MTIQKAQQIISAMQNLERLAQNKNPNAINASNGVSQFSNILMNQINNINESQKQAETLQDRFTLGDPGVSLSQMKAAELKAAIYTHGLVQVRNEVVKAYHEIMNMPI